MSETSTPNRFAQFKLVLLGESAVGKSSIVHRFVKNTFNSLKESTIGAAFLTQTITLPESQTTIKFEIWDTAGQERYKSLAPIYYRNANAALCVYDITSAASFSKAQDWIKELKKHAPEGILIGLVGNKTDLEDEREVDSQQVLEYVQELQDDNIIIAECSAKSGEGVVDVFYKIGRALPVEETIASASSRSRQVGSKKPGVNLRRAPETSSCC